MKTYTLPVLAILAAGAAAIVLLTVPRGGVPEPTEPEIVQMAETGDVILRADALSRDRITFLRLEEDSPMELIAIRGEDGRAYAALGTCQSCNGSPRAYYSQSGDALRCNNCGLTFPLSVIGTDGSGCHPILPDETALERSEADLVIHREALRAYEDLFAGIEEH